MKKLFYACFAASLFIAALAAQKTAAPNSTAAAKKSALDKAVLEAYVRHLYVMDSRITIQVGDPKPSEVAGFFDVNVHASMGVQSQDLKFLVSKDGSKILQANVFDANSNPFKHDLDLLKTDRAPSIGTKGAPVVLVEFSDFQCPYCKAEAQELRKNLIAAYPTQVRLYFKTFPLEQLHPWAKAAAIASRCVYKQNADAFWTYHDWIFEHQAEIAADNLKDKVLGWAKDTSGIDPLQLGQCMDAKATEKDVTQDQAEGEKLEVGGTPTLFVNGRRLTNAVDWPSLKNIIDYEIEYQKTAHDAGDDCGCSLDLKLPGAPQLAPSGAIKK